VGKSILKQKRANASLGSEIEGVFYLHRTAVWSLGTRHDGALVYKDRRLDDFPNDA
jgi:hypothetical protein